MDQWKGGPNKNSSETIEEKEILYLLEYKKPAVVSEMVLLMGSFDEEPGSKIKTIKISPGEEILMSEKKIEDGSKSSTGRICIRVRSVENRNKYTKYYFTREQLLGRTIKLNKPLKP